ncbi:uncharacterized protein CTRU02_215428 [Colletotrichum truncatum]|uniref:Uncharacterized protein n=1 Tax=Colletotrichum truncatum TaxID=5467 RepID=A0ACC3YCE8_COLTU
MVTLTSNLTIQQEPILAGNYSTDRSGASIDNSGKAQERFVLITALLNLIDPVRGEPTAHSLDRHPHDDSWKPTHHQKKFLDSFALISSTSRKGSDTASAACLEQGNPGGTILRLARNMGVPNTLIDQLHDILEDLIVVSKRERKPQEMEPVILRKVTALVEDKIRGLLEKICSSEVHAIIGDVITKLKQLPADDAEAESFRLWVGNLSLLAASDAGLDLEHLIIYVKWASRGRWTYSEQLEEAFGSEDGSLPLWLKHVYKLGRYYAATKAMLKLAVKQPGVFTGIHIKAVEAPRQENFALGNRREPLLMVLRNITKTDPIELREKLGQIWLTSDPENKFLRACTLKLTVHAEMQLLNFYDRNPNLTPRLLFMGTSKKSCYLCHEFILRHPLSIGVSACHQKVYPSWAPAPCRSAVRKKQKVLLWNLSKHLEETAARDLETRFGIRRLPTMDSTAGPSLTTTGTLSTGFWTQKSVMSASTAEDQDIGTLGRMNDCCPP